VAGPLNGPAIGVIVSLPRLSVKYKKKEAPFAEGAPPPRTEFHPPTQSTGQVLCLPAKDTARCV